MDWEELVAKTLDRPGMWVPRPHIDGLLTLWCGFGLGASDDNFDRFSSWLGERFPADDGHRSPLAPNVLLRRATDVADSGPLAETEDERVVALLSHVVAEYREAQGNF